MSPKQCIAISLIILMLPAIVWANVLLRRRAIVAVSTATTSVAGFCDSQSWNTFDSFRLDFDHTDDGSTACLSSATGTELGTLSGATIVNTPVINPGSDGDCLYVDANSDTIIFDNTGTPPYFRSVYGELMFMFMIDGDNTGTDIFFVIQQLAGQDFMRFYVSPNGLTLVQWEDNNQGVITTSIGLDVDLYYDKWIQFHIKWDTTRCDDGGGTEPCDTDATEEEFGVRYRVDDNQDGAWDGAFSAWVYETSATNMKPWNGEPTTNDFIFGLQGVTYTQDMWEDDIEISYDQPVW